MAVDPSLLLEDVAAMHRLCRRLWLERRRVHPRVAGGIGSALVAVARLHMDIVESHCSRPVARLSGRGPRGGRWVLREPSRRPTWPVCAVVPGERHAATCGIV